MDSLFCDWQNKERDHGRMAASNRIETDEEIERLTVLSRSRTEAASRVSRAQMLLAYRENPSFCAVGQRVGVHSVLSEVANPSFPVAIGSALRTNGLVLWH
jgi:hypothetical protein